MFVLLASALLTLQLGDFRLESGKMLPDCRVTYRTYGKMNAAKSNVVLVPTWFNGTSEDFSRFVGPQGLVDDRKYFVVVVDALGNGNSTSPSNSVLRGSKFPGIRIGDMVETQRRLLAHLQVEQAHAMLGVSMGGMQVFHWMVRHPGLLKKAVVIVSTPKMTEKDVQLWSKAVPIGRPAAGKPVEAEEKATGGIGKWLGMISGGLSQYRKYEQPFNPLRQFEAMVAHDIFKVSGGTPESAAARIQAAAFVVIATNDNALSTQLSIQMADLLKAPLLRLDGPCGHKAYDCELDKIAGPIARFLE